MARIELAWRKRAAGVRVRGDEPEVRRLLPLHAPGRQYDRYTSAVRYLDPPALFENRPSFRLLDVAWHNGGGWMQFGLCTHFDKLDVCEAVDHEYAHAAASASELASVRRAGKACRCGRSSETRSTAPRRMVVPAVTTVTTVTIRVDHGQPAFLLHWRDPAKVATAGGMYDVIPAGEFQLSTVAAVDAVADLDLWRNIVRELSEELLDAPEHNGRRGAPIDPGDGPASSICREMDLGRQPAARAPNGFRS